MMMTTANKQTNIRVVFKLFFLFAVMQGLMNSLGIVILKSISFFHVPPEVAGRLGLIKEIVSLVTLIYTARLMQKWGWSTTVSVSVAIPFISCIVMGMFPSFMTVQGLFIGLAFSFALLRITAYSTTVKIYPEISKQIQMLSLLEALGMLGSLVGLLVFSFYIQNDSQNTGLWVQSYWIFSGLFLLGGFFAYSMWGYRNPVDANETKVQNIFSLAWNNPTTLLFLALMFFYVFLEQGLLNWLPYFYCQTILLPEGMSCQLSILFPTYMMLGRFAFSWWIKSRSPITSLWLLLALSLGFYVFILLGLNWQTFEPLESWIDVPVFAYMVPLLGFFQAPLFSILCSLFINYFPHLNKESLLSLIGVSCALGGGIGTVILGIVFSFIAGDGVIVVLMGMLICFGMLAFFCQSKGYFGQKTSS